MKLTIEEIELLKNAIDYVYWEYQAKIAGTPMKYLIDHLPYQDKVNEVYNKIAYDEIEYLTSDDIKVLKDVIEMSIFGLMQLEGKYTNSTLAIDIWNMIENYRAIEKKLEK